MKKHILIFIIIFFCFINNIKSEKIITGAAEIFPPFVDKNIPNEGFSVEIIRAAYKAEGYDFNVSYFPWIRALNEVIEKNYDVLINAWYTEERANFLIYSDPYVKSSIKFIKRKNDPFEYNNLLSLTGKRIGTIREYGYGDDFLNSTYFEIEESNSFIINIRKLLIKRIDLTLEDEIVAKTILKNNPSLLNQIEFVENELSINNFYVVAPYNNPRSAEIIHIFNEGLAKIKADGTLKKIFDSYNFIYE